MNSSDPTEALHQNQRRSKIDALTINLSCAWFFEKKLQISMLQKQKFLTN
tara:strand:+ start:298 stop:447 length:150 start_codon:yes stop_codon:yes gene_type:complete